MKTSTNLFIIIIIATIGAIALNYSNIILSTSLAFSLGAIIVGIILLIYPFLLKNKQPTNSKTLYVGNLPYRANENDVISLFSDHGEVFAVRLMKDKKTGKRRGFGFIVMAAADASAAIEALNNKEYRDRTLKVREANDPKNEENV